MIGQNTYTVILFNSVSHAMQAEKILKKNGLPHKLIPVPRSISSDCGVCIRIPEEIRQKAESFLSGKVHIASIQSLQERK